MCASIQDVANAAPLNVKTANHIRIHLLHQPLQRGNSLNFAGTRHPAPEMRRLPPATARSSSPRPPGALLPSRPSVEDNDAALRSSPPHPQAPCYGEDCIWGGGGGGESGV